MCGQQTPLFKKIPEEHVRAEKQQNFLYPVDHRKKFSCKPMKSVHCKGVHFGGLNLPDVIIPKWETPNLKYFWVPEINFIHPI